MYITANKRRLIKGTGSSEESTWNSFMMEIFVTSLHALKVNLLAYVRTSEASYNFGFVLKVN